MRGWHIGAFGLAAIIASGVLLGAQAEMTSERAYAIAHAYDRLGKLDRMIAKIDKKEDLYMCLFVGMDSVDFDGKHEQTVLRDLLWQERERVQMEIEHETGKIVAPSKEVTP